MTAVDRRLACLAALALFTGCGSGAPGAARTRTPVTGTGPTPGTPVPARGRVLGPADDGFTGRLAVGETALLRLPAREEREPVLTGGSVLLIPVENLARSGHREWEIRAVRPGTSRISVPRPERTPAALTLVVV
ncbi:hypothetical protein ACQKM2_21050 [Streptomyces sp. NPDC004126]|uniref:hypothetical protein n=1 Tax=Streptomyces sp. NPDC004126 TaxID=3390695 RepID=UPI003D03B45F